MVCAATDVNKVGRRTSVHIYHVVGCQAQARPIADYSDLAMQINKLNLNNMRNSFQPSHLSSIFQTLHLLLTEIGIRVDEDVAVCCFKLSFSGKDKWVDLDREGVTL